MLARPLLYGLCVAHLIASIQVWLSNHALLDKVSQINTLYDTLVIPTGAVLTSLADPAIAMISALLYTLSIGLSLTCLSLGLMCVMRSHTRILWGIWAAVLIGSMLPGWSLWLTLYLTAIPAAVALTSLRYRRNLGVSQLRAWRAGGATLLISAGLGLVLFNPSAGTFSQVRQQWLAPLPGGPALIDSYYRYSLYAAESIKTLAQKTTKTARFTGEWPAAERKTLHKILIQHLYTPLPAAEGAADIHFHWRESQVAVSCNDHRLTMLPSGSSVRAISQNIQRWSGQCDSHQHLRWMMLGGFLLTPLLIITGLTVSALCRIAPLRASDGRLILSSATICALLTTLILYSVQPEPAPATGAAPSAGTPPASWLDRYHRIQGLSSSNGTDRASALWVYTRDDSAYLAALAYRGLGQTGNADTLPRLLEALPDSDHWFVQWEIYRAMLRLGWRPRYHADRL